MTRPPALAHLRVSTTVQARADRPSHHDQDHPITALASRLGAEHGGGADAGEHSRR